MKNELKGMSDYLKALDSIEHPKPTNIEGIYEIAYVYMSRTERLKLGGILFLKALFKIV